MAQNILTSHSFLKAVSIILSKKIKTHRFIKLNLFMIWDNSNTLYYEKNYALESL